MSRINFKIVTPERIVYEDQVDSITLPTKQGEITVLPEHIPLVSSLTHGELIIRKDNEDIPLVVLGGFVEIKKSSSVTILADAAEKLEEIDELRAQEAMVRAEKLIKEERRDEVKYTQASAALERSLARIKIAKKYRKRRPSSGAVIISKEKQD